MNFPSEVYLKFENTGHEYKFEYDRNCWMYMIGSANGDSSSSERDSLLGRLHQHENVENSTIKTRAHKFNKTITQVHDTHTMTLHTATKCQVCVKVKSFPCATNTPMVMEDVERSVALAKLMHFNKEVRDIVVSHIDVVPGHITIMERCTTDVWSSKFVKGADKLLEYITFGVMACGRLAMHGFEARDYKAGNVGYRGVGSTLPNTFCILDTTQIMMVDDSCTAVSTYPAVKEWIYGENSSFVGLAATAWSLIADAATVCDCKATSLAHSSVEACGIDDGSYVKPDKMDWLRSWVVEELAAKDDRFATLLLGMCNHYETAFPQGKRPWTKEGAVSDSKKFYSLVSGLLKTL